jgi:hypothetical protein
VIALDLDSHGSLVRWSERRKAAKAPEKVVIEPLETERLPQLPAILEGFADVGFTVAIFDTSSILWTFACWRRVRPAWMWMPPRRADEAPPREDAFRRCVELRRKLHVSKCMGWPAVDEQPRRKTLTKKQALIPSTAHHGS